MTELLINSLIETKYSPEYYLNILQCRIGEIIWKAMVNNEKLTYRAIAKKARVSAGYIKKLIKGTANFLNLKLLQSAYNSIK